MAIREMDHMDLAEKFKHLCAKGADSDCLLKFLEYAIPQYETEKRKLLSQAIDQTVIAISDQMMEDPYDLNLWADMSRLKKLANHLNIEINVGTN